MIFARSDPSARRSWARISRALSIAPARSSISSSAISSAGSSPAIVAIEIGLGGVEVACGDGGPRQLGAPLEVVGVVADRFAQRRRSPRSARPFSSRSACIARYCIAAAISSPFCASVRAAEHAGVEVGRDRACPSRTMISSAPARSPRARRRLAIADEVGLGVGEQPLLRRDLAEVQLHRLVVGLDLEDLLVERGGLAGRSPRASGDRRCCMYCAQALSGWLARM